MLQSVVMTGSNIEIPVTLLSQKNGFQSAEVIFHPL
jgi:hypothetical protein